jgi:hypothetical protein
MRLQKMLISALATALVATGVMSGSAAAAPHRHAKDVRKAPSRVTAKPSGDQVLCPIDWLDVPESSSTGVATEWLSYGESITVTPSLDHNIWAGVWFTGENGPEGWSNTSAPWYYPLPGAREYSLIGRLGNGAYQYIGQREMTYTNTSPGLIQRARFRVNDNTPGNGSGAFQVFVRYPCH